MIPKIFFRPNAPLSSLFSDLPNETIIIDEDLISETITDYQGNILVEKDSLPYLSTHIIKTLVMSFDLIPLPLDGEPIDTHWDSLCSWLKNTLEKRGWIPVTSNQMGENNKTVNGLELFFEMEIS